MKKLFVVGTLLMVAGLQNASAQDERKDRDDRNAVNRELLELIRELRNEVQALKKEVNQLKERSGSSLNSGAVERRREIMRRESDRSEGGRESGTERRATDRRDSPPRGARRDGDERPQYATPPDGDRRTTKSPSRDSGIAKYEKIFAAYDKNKDGKVSFEEWLSMKEGKMTDLRAARERTYFDAADKNKNKSLSFEEFYTSRTKKTLRREGDTREKREREGARRDGDRGREGARRDTDREREGVRGDRARESARESDRTEKRDGAKDRDR